MESSDTNGDFLRPSGPAPATAIRRAGFALMLLALGLAACKEKAPGLAPVVTAKLPQLEPELAKLIREHTIVVERSPSKARAHAQLGLVYEMNSLWSEARQSFDNALAIEPQEPLWVIHSALNRQREGDTAGALAFVREREERMRGSAPLQHLYGELLLASGDPEAAQQAFERAIVLAPDRAEGFAGRGEARLALGDAQGASEDFERSLALDPEYKSVRYQLGLAWRALGRTDDAERELAAGAGGAKRAMPDAISANAGNLRVGRADRLAFASSALDRKKPRQALPALKKVLEQDPADEDALVYRTNALMQLGRWDDALRSADETLAHHPDNALAWMYRSIAAMQLGRKDETRAALERALELDPGSHLAHAYLSGYHLSVGSPQEALRSAERSVELGPDAVEGHIALGRACAASGDPERARAAFERALAIAPDNAVARAELERLGVAAAPAPGARSDER